MYGMYRITRQFKRPAASEWQVARGKGVTTVRRNINIKRSSNSAHLLDDLQRGAISLSKPLPTCSLAKTVSKAPESPNTFVRIYLRDGKMKPCELCSLGYHTASSDDFLPTFRDIGPISKGQEFFMFLTSWLLKIGSICCTETSVRNYYYLLCDNLKGRRSHLLRGESLKSRAATWFSLSRSITEVLGLSDWMAPQQKPRNAFMRSQTFHQYHRSHLQRSERRLWWPTRRDW